ncbi:cytochrome P450 6k1, partial [Asbolus verrucosus]
MILIVLGCLVLVALYYHIFTKNYNYWESKGIPYDKPFFIFGSFYNVAARKEHLFERLRSLYDKFITPYAGIYIFNQPILMVRSPAMLKKILVKDFDKFSNRNIATNESVDPLAFHTLFIAKDSVWRNLRTKLSPVFTSGKMKLMLPLMKECAEDMHCYLDQHNGEVVETKAMMRKYTVDIISTCAFGINTRCFKNDNSEFFKMATKLVDFRSFIRSVSILCFFFLHQFVHIFRLTFADKTASDYFIRVFNTALKEREQRKIVRNDFIDLLNNMRKLETIGDTYKFDDIKMASQAIAFFSAGNDTTSITLSLTLYELSLNKTIQERLRKEIQETFEQYGEFTYEALNGMKYMDMVINESLRKYPLAPFLNRQANVDYTFDDGFTIEKGISVIVPVSGLHYDPEYFPDPQKYDPERFSDENKDNLKPYTYMPFGEGPRNCIGQRFSLLVSKVALAYVLKDFAFDTTDKTSVPLKFDPGSLFVQNRGGDFLKVVKL